ncbi:hypothetical protein AAG570_011748 [Ranatra chinensis]|uniref:MADF domain-containing protein n=1 Tax=Ranatra chinensis TaxID=642074 RepID=A0ABD0YGS8_9HEMI
MAIGRNRFGPLDSEQETTDHGGLALGWGAASGKKIATLPPQLFPTPPDRFSQDGHKGPSRPFALPPDGFYLKEHTNLDSEKKLKKSLKPDLYLSISTLNIIEINFPPSRDDGLLNPNPFRLYGGRRHVSCSDARNSTPPLTMVDSQDLFGITDKIWSIRSRCRTVGLSKKVISRQESGLPVESPPHHTRHVLIRVQPKTVAPPWSNSVPYSINVYARKCHQWVSSPVTMDAMRAQLETERAPRWWDAMWSAPFQELPDFGKNHPSRLTDEKGTYFLDGCGKWNYSGELQMSIGTPREPVLGRHLPDRLSRNRRNGTSANGGYKGNVKDAGNEMKSLGNKKSEAPLCRLIKGQDKVGSWETGWVSGRSAGTGPVRGDSCRFAPATRAGPSGTPAMAECEWPEDRVLDLIRHIRQHPCLWHSRDPNRLNKARKAACYALIANGFGLTPQEVKKKFANLMQTYRGCRRKIRSSGRSGRCPNYKPVWFAYDAINHFMEGHYTPHDELHPMVNRNPSRTIHLMLAKTLKVRSSIYVSHSNLVHSLRLRPEEVYLPWSDLSRSEYVGPNRFRPIAIFSGAIWIVARVTAVRVDGPIPR